MAPYEPLVAVIILTWNQKDFTVDCLRSFREVDYSNIEVILVDNGSTDGTAEAVSAEFPDVHLVSSPTNTGVAGGRNLGIEYANRHFKYDYIFVIDNDTLVSKGFLRPLVSALEKHSEAGIACPKVYLMDPPNAFDTAGGSTINFYTGSTASRGFNEIDQGQYDHDETPATTPAGIVLIRRAVIEACSGYDTAFNPYGPEDLDFALRAMAHGFAHRFVPNSIVYHKGNRSGFDGYSADYAAIKGRNLRRFLKRHSTPLQWLCFNALLPLLALRTICREIARGNLAAPFHLIRGYLRKRG